MPKRPTQNQIKAIIRSAFNDGAYAMIQIQQRDAVDKFRKESVDEHYAWFKRASAPSTGERE